MIPRPAGLGENISWKKNPQKHEGVEFDVLSEIKVKLIDCSDTD